MKGRSTSLVAISALLSVNSVVAQTGSSTVTLGDVYVTSRSVAPLPASSILTSVDVLGGDMVEDKNVMNSWELLGQMPGIQLTETRQGAESGKATFRAFNGEGYINGIKTLIDGVPSNVNSGNQRFIDMISSLDVGYIEVVRGTNDPRYGLHNIGGNINFVTRQGGNYTDGRLTYGSFNTREVQIAVGREQGNFAQNYTLSRQDSDGYRDHDESSKYSLGGKWFFTDDSSLFKAGVIARLHHHEAEEPGFITAEQLAASRTRSPAKNANDGDDRDMKHLSAHLDWQLNPALVLSNKLYYNSYDDDRTVTFTDYPIGNVPRQRRQWEERQTGLLSTLTWRAAESVTLTGGVNYEHQDNEYRRYRYDFSIPTDFSTPTRTQNDDSYTLKNTGAYIQAVIEPTDSLKIIPAFRVDRFSGDTSLPGDVNASLQDYGWIQQPKLSVVYSVTPEVSLYGNWGRTFQILTGSAAPAYMTAGLAEFDPSINTGKEIGIKYNPFAGTEARLAVWQQTATDEVANMPSTGTTVGLGKTKRRGIDLQVTSQLNDQWTLWASHAIQEAKVESAFTADGTSLAGKEVFSTPRYVSNVGANYQLTPVWRLGMQARTQGDYYIDELNEQGKYGGFAVLDASVRYDLSDTTSIDFQVKNLTDSEYEYVWYDNFFWGGDDQPMFSAAPGRSGFLSLNVKM